MLGTINARPTTTEHCVALQQCDDDDSRPWAGETDLRIRTVEGGSEALFAFAALQERRAQEDDEQKEAAVAEEGTIRPHVHLRLQLQQQHRSMGEEHGKDPRFCFTFTHAITFTLVSPPVWCRSGMNNKVAFAFAFTVCMTLAFPYRVMSLHLTISTAIRAVDDNQVCCLHFNSTPTRIRSPRTPNWLLFSTDTDFTLNSQLSHLSHLPPPTPISLYRFLTSNHAAALGEACTASQRSG